MAATAYFIQHRSLLEAVLSDAVDHVLVSLPPDPAAALAERIVRHEPLSSQLARIRASISAFTASVHALPQAERAAGILELRACISSAQTVVDTARIGVNTLVEVAPPTSRVGHLHTLEELIGPVPTERTWQDEWKSHIIERFGWFDPKASATN